MVLARTAWTPSYVRPIFCATNYCGRQRSFPEVGMSSLTRWVLAHKRIVVATWVVLLVAGIAAAGPASNALKQEFSVPGKEGWETNQAISQRYGGTGGNSAPLVPVITVPGGQRVDSPRVRADLARLDTRLTRALPGARLASY